MVGLDRTQVAASGGSADDLVDPLLREVEWNVRRWKRLILLEALGLAIAIPLGFFLLAVGLDAFIHLAAWARVLTFLAFLSVSGVLATRVARRWRDARFTADQAALAMERHSSGVDNRLINAIQIARESGKEGAELARAVLQENCESLRRIELQAAARSRPATLRLVAAAALAGITVLLWFQFQKEFASSAGRLLNPFDSKPPLYRTELAVEPGNVRTSPGSDVPLAILIKGKRPDHLVIHRVQNGERTAENVPVFADSNRVAYTLKGLEHSMSYWVEGGDYQSPTYEVSIPVPPRINGLRVTYHPPAYTRLPAKNVECGAGDLEALVGTIAEVTFTLDQPADQAELLVERPSALQDGVAKPPVPLRLALRKTGASRFVGELTFKDILSYELETRQDGENPIATPRHPIRTLADQSPVLSLTGLKKITPAEPTSAFPVRVSADDDYGLQEVGLFARKAGLTGKDAGWKSVMGWSVSDAAKGFQAEHSLTLTTLGVSAGDRVEVALRARDTDPAKSGKWTTGEGFLLKIGSPSPAALPKKPNVFENDPPTPSTAENPKSPDPSNPGNSNDPMASRVAEAIRSKLVMKKPPVPGTREEGAAEPEIMKDPYDSSMDTLRKILANNGGRPNMNDLSLSGTPGGSVAKMPSRNDPNGGEVPLPTVPKDIENLIGDLIKDHQKFEKEYETYNKPISATCTDPGVVEKGMPGMASYGMTGQTGNKEPPPGNYGGRSGAGTQGARAVGTTGTETTTPRHGDEPLEGDLKAPSRAGQIQETTPDPDPKTSEGTGGTAVKSENTRFSKANRSEFDTGTLDKMVPPQKTRGIVESKGKPISAEDAEKLYDLRSTAEQIMERLTHLKKEFTTHQLPTESLDVLRDRVQSKLDRLLGPTDNQTIYRMKPQQLAEAAGGGGQIFPDPKAGREESILREQTVANPIVDQPPSQANPGYEQAVKTYYERLVAK